MDKIKEAFKRDNLRWKNELPNLESDFGQFSLSGGFDFAYLKATKNSLVDYVDFKILHRMSSDYCLRYYSDGTVKELDFDYLEKGHATISEEDFGALTRISNVEFDFNYNKLVENELDLKDFHFFWSNDSPFSQWHKASFRLNGVEYSSAEQFMMAKKAELFGDIEIVNKILSTNNTKKQKELGRQVKNFDPEIWDKNKLKIVYISNNLKFSQNQHLKNALMETSSKLLVEASPTDTIWGIGLSENDPNIFDKTRWSGENLLGLILTHLREDFLKTEKYF